MTTENATPSDIITAYDGAAVVECMMTLMGHVMPDTSHPVGCMGIALTAVGLTIAATNGRAMVRHLFDEECMLPGRRDALALDLSTGEPGICLKIDKRLHVPALKAILRHARSSYRTKNDVITWSLTDRGLRVVQDDLDVLIPAMVHADADGKLIGFPWSCLSLLNDDATTPPFARSYAMYRLTDLRSAMAPAGEDEPVLLTAGERALHLRPTGLRSRWESLTAAALMPMAI